MKKYWIVTAILVVLCAAVPVVASEALPALEEQVKDILVRLEKVEAQQERIETLERQVAQLLAMSDVPPEIPAEGVVDMTAAQYKRWVDEEILRILQLVPEWEAAFVSDEVDRVFAALFGILDAAFEFYDAHSRIVTPDPTYAETQSELACYMDVLEPFRDLENATFLEVMSFFVALSDENETFFMDCDPEALDELVQLLSLE
ncbi:MAG: hypothetical protein OXI80_15385 [Caldilineaceae bacterium]|nr:hypothetical protein [Caldilineaceae bacterium]MDE0339053.1 hypothetical protein [Caldilineaceae bacterium]